MTQATPLVRLRAQAMQEAVPVGAGAMAAILGMDAAKVIAGCAEVSQSFGIGSSEVVEAVNFNDAAQTVIAGSKAAVEKACEVQSHLQPNQFASHFYGREHKAGRQTDGKPKDYLLNADGKRA